MIDLDDEEAFLAALPGAMAKQQSEGISIAPKEDEAEPDHKGISVVRRQIIEPVPEPIPYEAPPLDKRIGVVDLETDPFKYDRKPEPFCAGFALDDGSYTDFWGDDCVDAFFEYLFELDQKLAEQGEELVIYAHNGGKFDFHYFMNYLDDDSRPFMINQRIVKINFNNIEFRDSYSIMPVALRKLMTTKWAKKEIDYAKMERLFREENKAEILEYLRYDCMTLLENVKDFIDRFGWRITIASTALPLLRSFHGFTDMDGDQDATIRPFYKGGRVQCFRTGILHGDFIMVDSNSAYAAAMHDYDHPVSAVPRPEKDLEKLDFAVVDATSRGCLGIGDGLGFYFPNTRTKFFATSHEIRAGLDTGTLDVHRVVQGWRFTYHDRFDRFVDHFYGLRTQASDAGDIAGKEFYKLVLNSPYGKLCQSTAKYRDYLVNPASTPLPAYGPIEWGEIDGKKVCLKSPQGWRPDFSVPGMQVWSRPKRNAGEMFFNIAAGASITGAARAGLWRAVCASEGVAYCDTDSLICERFHGDMHETRLGAWKVEARGDAVLVAGKKMYAFLSKTKPVVSAKWTASEVEEHTRPLTIDGTDFYLVKKAHKGVQLRTEQILEIVHGGTVEVPNESPTFGLGGKVSFVKRRVKMTAKDVDVKQLEFDL